MKPVHGWHVTTEVSPRGLAAEQQLHLDSRSHPVGIPWSVAHNHKGCFSRNVVVPVCSYHTICHQTPEWMSKDFRHSNFIRLFVTIDIAYILGTPRHNINVSLCFPKKKWGVAHPWIAKHHWQLPRVHLVARTPQSKMASWSSWKARIMWYAITDR